ncbi:MAG TPA: hypothetical protein VKC51_08575 [Lacunisphaera sp.]|nr:hypothetical protein [Lacunisphaera sp.]
MLKVNHDLHNRDYIDYLTPFLSHVLNGSQLKAVKLDQVKKDVVSAFGLNIPKATIELCLKRMAKHGWLKKESHQYLVTSSLPDSEITERRAAANRDAEVVITALILFAQNAVQRTITTEQAYAAVVEYLQQFSIECLSTYVKGTPLPEIADDQENSNTVLVSLFVKDAYKSASPLFEQIVNLVKGHMLSNALLCPDLEGISRKFDDVKFFFDTPLLFKILGLDGGENKKLALELISLIKNLRGKIFAFSHTIEEINSIFQYCETHLNDPRAKSLIIREVRRTGKGASDLILLRGKMHDTLRGLGIEIFPTPSYRHTALQIDERAFEHLYRDEAPGIRDSAIKHDINSVRSVYVLRMNVQPNRLEDSIAVFVTSNSAFSKSAFDYGKKHESSREVSTVITDFSLANLAWLKAPVGAPNLPQREVVAYCYAALQPNSKLWLKYLEELEKLRSEFAISERDHQLLRFSLRAEEELMTMTLGSDDEISGLSVLRIRDKIVAEITAEKDEVISKQDLQISEVSEKANALKEILTQRDAKTYWFADRIGKYVGYLVWTGGWVVIGASSIVSAFFANSAESWTWNYKVLLTTVTVAALAFGILSSMYGISFAGLREQSSKWATNAAFRKLKAWLG